MMSEPGKTLEIEDVLSSIRRLVSQDAAPPRATGGMMHRSASLSAAQCLVLSPALRVEEEEEDEAHDLVDDLSEELEPDATTSDAESWAEADAAPEPESAEEDAPEPTGEAPAPMPEPVAQEPIEAAAQDVPAADEDLELSETEVLLLQAETALAGSDALIDEADAALGAPAEEAAPAPEATDLGSELARLESTIAEMEAATSGRAVEFEPEEGDHFEAEGAEPLVDLPEEFDAEAFAEAALQTSPPEAEDAIAETEPEPAQEPEPGDAEAALTEEEAETLSMAARFGAPAEIDDAEFADEPQSASEPPAEAAPAETVDPDLQDASWAGREERMDWVEAVLNLAHPKASRRLHLSDAEERPSRPAVLRSSYDAMRAEYAQDAESDAQQATQNGEALDFDASLIDEEALRAMVAQMIREELRGTLGERITANVRKLVRREIQRALMGSSFE